MTVPWPETGDSLFMAGGYRALLAFPLTGHPALNDGIIASGYKDAGDALIQSLLDNGRNDGLVLPILFCYRHYMELRIKDIIEILNMIEDEGEHYSRTHDLKDLWSDLRSKVEMDEDDQEAFESVEHCVMEFHEVDEKSMNFRYYKCDFLLKQIDLGHLHSVMEKIAKFLDALLAQQEDRWERGQP